MSGGDCEAEVGFKFPFGSLLVRWGDKQNALGRLRKIPELGAVSEQQEHEAVEMGEAPPSGTVIGVPRLIYLGDGLL